MWQSGRAGKLKFFQMSKMIPVGHDVHIAPNAGTSGAKTAVIYPNERRDVDIAPYSNRYA